MAVAKCVECDNWVDLDYESEGVWTDNHEYVCDACMERPIEIVVGTHCYSRAIGEKMDRDALVSALRVNAKRHNAEFMDKAADLIAELEQQLADFRGGKVNDLEGLVGKLVGETYGEAEPMVPLSQYRELGQKLERVVP